MGSYYPLDLDVERKADSSKRSPFPHQADAFRRLEQLYRPENRVPRASLLVLPTGAGKTFTAVSWLSRKVIPRGMRVLWLAQSFHLLDQARESFVKNAREIPPPARFLNVRVVSSHPSHERVASIATTDNVVIVTSQTAIAAMVHDSLAVQGDRFVSALEEYVKASAADGLLVVLDEAHHAPAYGCRTLLKTLGTLVPNLWLLGLTATPTYTDESRRGWLEELFADGIVHQARQSDLMAQNILAKPVFEEMPTGQELEVDSALYRRLVQEHKDLPEDLVEKLASNAPRNDAIVAHYVQNRKRFGKTLIFTDRWVQCLYIRDKLRAKGVRAGAVYSHVDGAERGAASSTTIENARQIAAFKNNELDVLVNVRMLTEGTDVPDVRTVFVTRQTTSSILLTQMIGRALRGKRAGGGEDKDVANIVLFVDKWRQLLDIWATPDLKGGVAGEMVTRGHAPMDFIAIHLVEALVRSMESTEVSPQPYVSTIPVGWYVTEYSVATLDDGKESTEHVQDFVMVFDHVQAKYARFVERVLPKLPPEWGREDLQEAWMAERVEPWVEGCFDAERDDVGKALRPNLRSLARHKGATGQLPKFVPFDERKTYDLDALAGNFQTVSLAAVKEALLAEFGRAGSMWPAFYKGNFDWFERDFYNSVQRLSRGPVEERPEPISVESAPISVLDPSLRQQVHDRDGRRCLACGASGQGIKLEIDHIIPRAQGGRDDLQNLQTLCRVCNGPRYKGVNAINFLRQGTPLTTPKDPSRHPFLPRQPSEDAERALRRLVNFFYHCGAVCGIKTHKRASGRNYANWEVQLYRGNNPEWLLKHHDALVEHVAEQFGEPQVEQIMVS